MVAPPDSLSCSLVHRTVHADSRDAYAESCATFILLNVTALKNAMININVASMVQANPSLASVWVRVANLTLTDGAVLVIDGGAVPAGSIGRDFPAVSMLIEGVVGRNGALVFIGTFPPKTTIEVKDCTMMAARWQVLKYLAVYFDGGQQCVPVRDECFGHASSVSCEPFPQMEKN
jgi:hypothetical protein